jgi:hypothetical protein
MNDLDINTMTKFGINLMVNDGFDESMSNDNDYLEYCLKSITIIKIKIEKGEIKSFLMSLQINNISLIIIENLVKVKGYTRDKFDEYYTNMVNDFVKSLHLR